MAWKLVNRLFSYIKIIIKISMNGRMLRDYNQNSPKIIWIKVGRTRKKKAKNMKNGSQFWLHAPPMWMNQLRKSVFRLVLIILLRCLSLMNSLKKCTRKSSKSKSFTMILLLTETWKPKTSVNLMISRQVRISLIWILIAWSRIKTS